MRLEDFIGAEVSKITTKYKIEQYRAEELLRDLLEKHPSLVNSVDLASDVKEVYRLKGYKDLSKRYRKEVYYYLRKYRPSEDPGSQEHISTKEREPYSDEFFTQLYNFNPDIVSIIDIGGGVFPLTFPFEMFPKLKYYVWIDKDKKAYDILSSVSNDRLILHNENIGARPWSDYLPAGLVKFDIALMIKLVSVVRRQERVTVPLLATVPADTYLVTSPKEAMTKKESIERRERAVLKDFISLTGRDVVGELDVPNEFGYFLK